MNGCVPVFALFQNVAAIETVFAAALWPTVAPEVAIVQPAPLGLDVQRPRAAAEQHDHELIAVGRSARNVDFLDRVLRAVLHAGRERP